MSNIVYLNVDTSDKKFMFELGRLFAQGKQIRIQNLEKVLSNIEIEKNKNANKSFNMMIKFWADNNLSPDIFTSKQEKKKCS